MQEVVQTITFSNQLDIDVRINAQCTHNLVWAVILNWHFGINKISDTLPAHRGAFRVLHAGDLWHGLVKMVAMSA